MGVERLFVRKRPPAGVADAVRGLAHGVSVVGKDHERIETRPRHRADTGPSPAAMWGPIPSPPAHGGPDRRHGGDP